MSKERNSPDVICLECGKFGFDISLSGKVCGWKDCKGIIKSANSIYDWQKCKSCYALGFVDNLKCKACEGSGWRHRSVY